MTLFDTKYVVSIHALRFQRAMRHRHRHWLPWQGFNPRPPFPEGDAEGENAMCRLYEVSIHALRFQRAMQGIDPNALSLGKFQSTPSVSRGRCRMAIAARQARTRFQSTPSVSRGRCSACRIPAYSLYGFNPRPPFPEGDAGSSHLGAQIQDVSIHALRFQRAMPGTGAAGEPITWFQSTPSVSRGRCAIAPRMMPTASMFQSTPSVSRGRCCFPQGEP